MKWNSKSLSVNKIFGPRMSEKAESQEREADVSEEIRRCSATKLSGFAAGRSQKAYLWTSSKVFWNVVMTIGAIIFLSYAVQLINKKEFISEVSPYIVQDRGGKTFHLAGILNAVYSENTGRQALWLYNPLVVWRASVAVLCSFGIIAVLFVMYRSQKKNVGLKQQEIERKEAEDKSTNNYKNDRIDKLEREIREYQALNKNLESRIAPLTEAAKQMQTKLKEMEAAYHQQQQAKDEEIRLIKEAAVIEIEKVKKTVEKQQNDIVL